MQGKLALLPAAAAAIFLVTAPASAQWNRGTDYYDNTNNANSYQTQRSYNRNQGWRGERQGWNEGGWNSRNVSGSDPSFGNRSGINAARRSGRCVTDLGYGRFEYCGR